jgi:small GTP-binding protein
MEKRKANLFLIGECDVGKTCINYKYILIYDFRYNEGEFKIKKILTIGINDIFNKKVKTDKDKIEIKFKDTSGDSKYRESILESLRKANGIILVYDITDKSTFLKLSDYIYDIGTIKNCKSILVGNKKDLEVYRQVTTKEAKIFAEKLQIPFYETSAKTGSGIEEMMERIISDIIYDKQNISQKNEQTIQTTESFEIHTSPNTNDMNINTCNNTFETVAKCSQECLIF